MNLGLGRIPYQDLRGRFPAELATGLGEILAGGQFLGGPVVEAFEVAFARACGVGWAVGTASGSDALLIALALSGVRPGDEVIIPALSFFATAGAVLRLGALPVVVDVLPDRPLIDPAQVERAWNVRSRLVVPVALYGEPPPSLGLPPDQVVDDLAQAVGTTPFPRQGHLSCVSFYPTKVLGAAGDGGAILGDDASLAHDARAMGHHGRTAQGRFARVRGEVGFNSRLGAIQARLLLHGLSGLPTEVRRRRAIATHYRGALDGVAGLRVVPFSADSGNLAHVALLHPDRDGMVGRLRERGVETAIYYPRGLHQEPALQVHSRVLPCPNAESFSAQVFCLPCRGNLSDDEVASIVSATRAAAETL